MTQDFAAQEDKIFKEEVEQVKQWFKVGVVVPAVLLQLLLLPSWKVVLTPE